MKKDAHWNCGKPTTVKMLEVLMFRNPACCHSEPHFLVILSEAKDLTTPPTKIATSLALLAMTV
jgi:hypothetical protein